MVRTDVIDSAADLRVHAGGWDALAVAAGRPYCSPGWMLPWWRNLAPAGAELRTVAVLDDSRLIGIAPFFAQRTRLGVVEYRLLGAGDSHRIAPLAAAGTERAVAEAVTAALDSLEPRAATLRLEAADAASPWPGLLARAWGDGRPARARRELVMPAPVLDLSRGDFEEWLWSRPKKSRKQFQRLQRRHAERGVVVRLAEPGRDFEDGSRALTRLHHARWGARGGSVAGHRSIEGMLADIGHEAADAARFRLWLMEDAEGETISAQLFVAAGGRVAAWGGGFEAAHAALAPGLMTVFAALEDAFRRGDAVLDFGGGEQAFKGRFADSDAPLAWVRLFAPGRSYAATALRLAPSRLAWSPTARAAGRRLPPRVRAWLKSARAKIG